MNDQDLQDKLAGLFSGLDDPEPETAPAEPQPKANGQIKRPAPTPPVMAPASYPALPPAGYPRPGVNWRLIIWSVLATVAGLLLLGYGQSLFFGSGQEETGAGRAM
ncbi:MAG: hypothetical protein AB1801_29230 [Chloroflexota bacterium]